MMRFTAVLLISALIFSACGKNNPRTDVGVNIHLLTSFTTKFDTTVKPALYSITDAVLAPVPLVANRDIIGYSESETTFYLKKNIKPAIEKFAGDKAFAVTVDGKPVYYGRFHPAYYSSIVFGIATIDPIVSTTEGSLRINFARLTPPSSTHPLDKRNDPLILAAFSSTQRLR